MTTTIDTPTPPAGGAPLRARLRGHDGLFDPTIIGPAILASFRKLDPRELLHNPVIFVVEIGSVYTSFLFFRDLSTSSTNQNVFAALVTFFLWATVLFANFAEAMAEGRGKAQAAALRKARTETMAHRRLPDGTVEEVSSSLLDVGDECVVVGRRVDPVRRRRDRRHRVGRRVGHHRRIGSR